MSFNLADELKFEYNGTYRNGKRLDNESFVKAWQSARTVEEFLEFNADGGEDSAHYAWKRAERFRRRNIPLKELYRANDCSDHLARLAAEWCAC